MDRPCFSKTFTRIESAAGGLSPAVSTKRTFRYVRTGLLLRTWAFFELTYIPNSPGLAGRMGLLFEYPRLWAQLNCFVLGAALIIFLYAVIVLGILMIGMPLALCLAQVLKRQRILAFCTLAFAVAAFVFSAATLGIPVWYLARALWVHNSPYSASLLGDDSVPEIGFHQLDTLGYQPDSTSVVACFWSNKTSFRDCSWLLRRLPDDQTTSRLSIDVDLLFLSISLSSTAGPLISDDKHRLDKLDFALKSGTSPEHGISIISRIWMRVLAWFFSDSYTLDYWHLSTIDVPALGLALIGQFNEQHSNSTYLTAAKQLLFYGADPNSVARFLFSDMLEIHISMLCLSAMVPNSNDFVELIAPKIQDVNANCIFKNSRHAQNLDVPSINAPPPILYPNFDAPFAHHASDFNADVALYRLLDGLRMPVQILGPENARNRELLSWDQTLDLMQGDAHVEFSALCAAILAGIRQNGEHSLDMINVVGLLLEFGASGENCLNLKTAYGSWQFSAVHIAKATGHTNLEFALKSLCVAPAMDFQDDCKFRRFVAEPEEKLNVKETESHSKTASLSCHCLAPLSTSAVPGIPVPSTCT